jgi:hypothetical protein
MKLKIDFGDQYLETIEEDFGLENQPTIRIVSSNSKCN